VFIANGQAQDVSIALFYLSIKTHENIFKKRRESAGTFPHIYKAFPVLIDLYLTILTIEFKILSDRNFTRYFERL